MLNLDDPGVAEFHRLDPRWRRSGRGRLFRSPTFFEDLVKTVTSCNVTWPSTVGMNRRLCEAINPAFPSPAQIARRRPAMLRARCGVGYRDARLVQLAKMHVSGAIDPEWLEDPANDDEAVYRALLALPGIGPYGAGNLMQLLGRYSRLAIDTESLRHGRAVLGFTGGDRQVERRLRAHYEPFGRQRFRSYWFEMWTFYEAKHGKAWTWEPRAVGTAFTAALLKD
jgi:3-methyladenine DNA glycosylase/8-oxoguanine DNA glycosylase